MNDNQPEQTFSIELDPRVRIAPEVARGGTLEGWKEMAKAVVKLPGTPHFRLSLIAGMAGLFIDYLKLNSCGINWSGKTSIGKTTAQMLAVSAWTSPEPALDGSLMQTANTTLNSLELQAARANGTVLAIDELALLSGQQIQHLLFSLASNRGKARLTKEIQQRTPPIWHAFIMTSPEQTIEAKIRADRVQHTAGGALRILDIGLDGHVSACSKSQIDAIRRQALTHYGHAGLVMAQALLDSDRQKVANALQRFTTELGSGRRAGAEQRSAEVFALLKLAGICAVNEIGLLPSEIDVDGTIGWALNAFMESGGQALDPETRAIEKLQFLLTSEWSNTVIVCGGGGGYKSPIAWYDKDAVYVPHDTISRLAESELAASAIGVALRKRGDLWEPNLEKGKNTTRRATQLKGTFYPLRRDRFGRDENNKIADHPEPAD